MQSKNKYQVNGGEMEMSVGIILASHGMFAKGILQTSEMIFGKQEKVFVCSLLPEDSPEDLQQQLIAAVDSFDADDEILFLVDLWGGTPFNLANQLVQQQVGGMEIVSGLNLPMLLQAYNERFDSETRVADIAQTLVFEAKEGIRTSAQHSDTKTQPVSKQEGELSMTVNQMGSLGIQHVRLDERLIHGQVATLWIGNLGVTRVMIVDDQVVNDPIAKASLQTAVPGGVKLSILKTASAASRLNEGLYKNQKVMIIAKNIQTIFDLIDAGVPIEKFNLGNSSPKEDTKPITKSVFLSESAIERLQQLETQGITVTAQMVPMEETKSFSQFYGK